MRVVLLLVAIGIGIVSSASRLRGDDNARGDGDVGLHVQFESLRLALVDLSETFGASYSRGQEFLEQLDALEKASRAGDKTVAAKLVELRNNALLANPLLEFEELVLLKRRRGQLGLPVNHKCNSGIEQTGYDNEIALLSLRAGLRTLHRPMGGEFVGEIDMHWDADRLLFTMPHEGELGREIAQTVAVSATGSPAARPFCVLPAGWWDCVRLDCIVSRRAVLAWCRAGVQPVPHECRWVCDAAVVFRPDSTSRRRWLLLTPLGLRRHCISICGIDAPPSSAWNRPARRGRPVPRSRGCSVRRTSWSLSSAAIMACLAWANWR